MITEKVHLLFGHTGSTDPAPFTCPVCKNVSDGKKAFHVLVEGVGDAYCCSKPCAKLFEAHCEMPPPRPVLG